MSQDEHTHLVRQIEKEIHALGLITFKKSKRFTGFIPDIVTNVGGTTKDWVLIDIINTQESLIRDIGGLLIAKANVEKDGGKIRAIVAVCSKAVTDVMAVRPLLSQYIDFWVLEPEISITSTLNAYMLIAARENLATQADLRLNADFETAKHTTKKAEVTLPFDSSKIAWQNRTNEKGPFQISEDYNNLEHKGLLQFLNEHGGIVSSEGYRYWIYSSGSTIGRRTLVKEITQ